MSDNAWRWVVGCLVSGLVLAGCDGMELCRKCKRPPKTVKVEADWKELAAAIKDKDASVVGTAGATVTVDTVNVTFSSVPQNGSPEPAPSPQVVTVAGWNDLVAALKARQISVPNGPGSHNIRHTFAFRFAPPWFDADRRSLLTSYVVFPEEASFAEWSKEEDKDCEGDDALASVCPDKAFYKAAMGPYLRGLAQCATDSKKVELNVLGFASETGLSGTLDELDCKEGSNSRYCDAVATIERDDCKREDIEIVDGKRNHSNMFNLIIANERAEHTADMLRDMMAENDAFEIKPVLWCSHDDMVTARRLNDRDAAKGLMNRRAEVRLASLPGCLNLAPNPKASADNG